MPRKGALHGRTNRLGFAIQARLFGKAKRVIRRRFVACRRLSPQSSWPAGGRRHPPRRCGNAAVAVRRLANNCLPPFRGRTAHRPPGAPGPQDRVGLGGVLFHEQCRSPPPRSRAQIGSFTCALPIPVLQKSVEEATSRIISKRGRHPLCAGQQRCVDQHTWRCGRGGCGSPCGRCDQCQQQPEAAAPPAAACSALSAAPTMQPPRPCAQPPAGGWRPLLMPPAA